VLCVDETAPVPARRASPFRPRPKGPPARASTIERDRGVAFDHFLAGIDQAVPADLDVHVVMTHGATDMSEALWDWRLTELRLEFHHHPHRRPVDCPGLGVDGRVGGLGVWPATRELAAAVNAWVGRWH
jgi:hypothetical protein